MDFMKKIQQKNDEMNKKLAALKAEMQSESKELMKEAFKEFFSKYGEVVECIFWTQYTPYFNDGEACTFSVNQVFLKMKDDEEVDDYEGSELLDESDLARAKENYRLVEEWLKDKLGAAKKHQTEYMKKWGRNPFEPDRSYAYNPKTEEQKIANWKPVYGLDNLEDAQAEIDKIENFIQMYPTLKQDFDKVSNFISSIDEDLMETMFGDHVKVIVSVDGIETEEYGHD